VACVLVEGPGAAELVESLAPAKSGRRRTELPDDRLTLARFGGQNGEEVVLHRRNADSIEVHCHGGYAAAAMIEEALRQRGCAAVDWRQWAAHSQSDPIAADAVAAIADAPTLRTAGILLDQYHGALRRQFDAIENDIKRKDNSAARTKIDSLSAYISLGMHLTRPWRVVVGGPPNAGKSSLVNALLGFERSIVHHTPGTTRDVVTATTAIDGWPIELCDTAGLRAGAEKIEKAGLELAQRQIREADLVLLVFDLTARWSAENRALVESLPKAIVVQNKVDLQPAKDDRPSGVKLSALTGVGIGSLVQSIAANLVPIVPPAGAAVPFAAEQLELVRRMAQTLEG
jgi:tRNA modification GTPase